MVNFAPGQVEDCDPLGVRVVPHRQLEDVRVGHVLVYLVGHPLLVHPQAGATAEVDLK